jgi:hypothetical protein
MELFKEIQMKLRENQKKLDKFKESLKKVFKKIKRKLIKIHKMLHLRLSLCRVIIFWKRASLV